MFDFAKLTETLTDIVGNFANDGPSEGGNLLELLQHAGLDPRALTGLTQDEVVSMLAEHGIDASPFLDGRLGELLTNLGLSDPASILQSLSDSENA